jgi:quercetin dioxygenase-like cupin family protein
VVGAPAEVGVEWIGSDPGPPALHTAGHDVARYSEERGKAVSERKRGIKIYRGTDAVGLMETDFMTSGESSAEGISGSVRAGAACGSGSDVKVLVRDAEGFSLVHVWFKANYPLPRHSHNADCMYYVISGRAMMGNQTLWPGDSFFVPADAPYQYLAGPEGVEILEVRHGAKQFDIKMSDTSADRWRALAAANDANHEQWAETETSPTFSARASGR